MMAAREARKQEALARRAAKAVETAESDDAGTAVVAETDPKKAAIAAALARAKAKKPPRLPVMRSYPTPQSLKRGPERAGG